MPKKYKVLLKNNPYSRPMMNKDALKREIYDTKDIEKRSEILKNTLTIFMSFRKLVGKHYDKLTDTKVRYKIFKGAKGTKKSETIIAWQIFCIIFKPKANIIVMRRYMKDHSDTTVAGFQTVLQRMEKLFNYQYTKFWKLSSPQANVPYIWYNRYGLNGEIKFRQEVRLVSWENTDFGSQKWHNGGYAEMIHWEEPLEKVDTKKGGDEITDEFMEEKWPIIEESFLRYDSITNDPEEVGIQQIIMSFNSWNKYHFVVKNYVYAFMAESEELLEKYGKQEYFSTKAHNGLGTYIMLMTWKVNEFRTRNEILMIFALRKRNYRDYRTIYLGLDYIFSGGVLSDIWNMVKVVDDIDHRIPDKLQFGGDWSSSKDRSGMMLQKTWIDDNGKIEKIRFSNAKLFDKTKGDDLKRANKLLYWTDKILEKYKDNFEDGIVPTPIALIDNRDAFWIDYMRENASYMEGMGKHVAYLPASKHDTHKNSAGQLSRAFAIRALIISEKIEFTVEAYNALKEEAETLEWIKEGEITDGKDDAFQMTGYAISNLIPQITKSTGLGYN